MPKESTIKKREDERQKVLASILPQLAKRWPKHVGTNRPSFIEVRWYRATGPFYVKVWQGTSYVEVEEAAFLAALRALPNKSTFEAFFTSLGELPSAITN